MSRIRQRFQLLLKVEEPPHRTALAFAVGIWIAFFPILGIHTGMALAIAVAFRLSKVAVLLGTWVNNPWTIAPMLTAGTFLGCLILDVPPGGLRDIDWAHITDGSMRETIGRLGTALRPYWWPYALGNTLLGLLTAGLGYVVLRRFLERRRGTAAAAGGP